MKYPVPNREMCQAKEVIDTITDRAERLLNGSSFMEEGLGVMRTSDQQHGVCRTQVCWVGVV